MLLGLAFLLNAWSVTASPQQEGGPDLPAAVREAREWQQAGEWGEAEAVLRAALNPNSPAVLKKELADVLLEQGRGMVGSSDLSRHLSHGLIQEALTLYREVGPEEYADRLEVVAAESRCESLLGRPEEGIALLEALLVECRQAPDAASPGAVLEAIVHQHLEQGQAAAAAEVLARKSPPGELRPAARALLLLHIAAARKDADQALELSERLAQDPDVDIYTVAYLGWEALSGGKGAWLETLLHLYSRLLVARPESSAVLLYRGVARLYAGDPAGAEQDLRQALEDPEREALVLPHLGLACRLQNQPDEAKALYEKLLALGTAQRRAALDGLVEVAVLYGRARRYQDSAALYRKILAAEPTNEWAHQGLPLCFKGLGDVEGARTAYEAGLAELPGHPQLQNDLALLLWGDGQRDEARALFAQAMAAGSLDSTENLGVIASAVDHDRERAADFFARVLVEDPQREKSRFYRELLLTVPGDPPGGAGSR